MTQDLEIPRLRAQNAERVPKPGLVSFREANVHDAATHAFDATVHGVRKGGS
jgi:hypothetical protein